ELKKKPYTRVAIFAHGGVLICAQLYAGILKAEEAFDALTPYGGIVRINLNKE
ncbi:alpha-ribazole phosphatase, partial [Bacteroides uniformis]